MKESGRAKRLETSREWGLGKVGLRDGGRVSWQPTAGPTESDEVGWRGPE